MLIALGLLIAPAAYHRIVEYGEDTEGLHQFTIAVMPFALLPFSFSMGINFFVAAEKVTTRPIAFLMSGAAIFVSLFFWYGLEAIDRRDLPFERIPGGIVPTSNQCAMKENKSSAGSEKSGLDKKIKHVLTEARMVLPGAQALLGFQFATMLTKEFESLPQSSKYLHLISLALIAIAIIFLMTPAAYHRIVEEGEETEHFHRFASRMVILSMVPLALGVIGDFFVVVRKTSDSIFLAAAAAGMMLLFFHGLWFGFTVYRKRHPKRSEAPVLVAAK